ncbi:MAG: hypothetical protein CVU87_14085, partial [Firmicutes bacterium HGW-Firmicutes-12]
MKNFRRLIIFIMIGLLILTPGGNFLEASPQDVYSGNGDIGIYVNVNGVWANAGCLTFNEQLQTKEIDLTAYISDLEGLVDIKLTKIGGGAGHLDAVSLADQMPIQVLGQSEIVQKIIRQDYDLVDINETGMIIIFENTVGSILSVTGRIEGERISEIPFQFPLDNMYQTITENASFYSYRLNSDLARIIVDGSIEEVALQIPFMEEFVLPSTGHPPGTIYTWVRNDDQNLYVTFDVTPDNTMDGAKDYAKVYVKTPEGVKVYKVTVQETQWGKAGFVYTPRVEYQHKAYEFAIPLSELCIDSPEGQVDIPLAFSAYGTMAAPPEVSFQAKVDYSSVGQPYGITKGDFNNDGKEDLAVANTVSGKVSIMMGNGDGTFQSTVYKDIIIGGSRINPKWITAGRFN